MQTPIYDFVQNYIKSGAARFHMPGHKGVSFLGCEPGDITEIEGADVLYTPNGIILNSEENATALFQTANGFDIRTEPLQAKGVFGYVASEPSCYDVMTGYEYLEFIASIYHVSEGDFVRNMRYLCGRLKLDQKELGNRIANYSHGMKQKLCLAGSLLYNPPIWILDEPTVGLDIMAVEELKKMMREYANHGKTVFVTSHNIDLVSRLCDRVAIINEGQVAVLYDLNKEPNRRLHLSRAFMKIYGEEV